jgi:hypothetical protein
MTSLTVSYYGVMSFDIVIMHPKLSPILIIPSFHGVTTLAPKAQKISILVRYAMDDFTLMHHVIKLPLPVIVENEGVHFEGNCIRD